MRIGGSLLLIALGAILAWGVTYQPSGVDLDIVGEVLMVVGVIGFVATVIMASTRRRTDVIHRSSVAADPGEPERSGRTVRRTTYVEPQDPEV